MSRKQKYDALMEFIARVQGATGLTTPHIERVIASGIDITKATPADVYKLATGMDLVGPAQAYVPPVRQYASEAAELPPLQDRPYVQEAIRMALPALDRINPALAQRVRAGDPQAAMEVMQLVTRNKGELPVPAVDDVADEVSELGDIPADMIDAPARQMELPMGEVEEHTGLIPYGFRGAGVPVGGVSGPGVPAASFTGLSTDVNLPRIGTTYGPIYNPGTDMIPAPLRGLPGAVNPSYDLSLDVLLRRLGHSAGVSVRSPRVIDALPGPVIRPAAPAASPRGSHLQNAAAAAVGAATALGVGEALRRGLEQDALTDAAGPESAPLTTDEVVLVDDTPVLVDGGDVAALAAESSPPPAVHDMVYPKGPQDRADAMLRARDVALGGTLIAPSLTLSDLGVEDMSPAQAQRINDATQAVIDADRAIERFNRMNNPWRRR